MSDSFFKDILAPDPKPTPKPPTVGASLMEAVARRANGSPAQTVSTRGYYLRGRYDLLKKKVKADDPTEA